MFKEMDPKLLKAILADEVDLLTPLVEADQKIYNDASCPRCGGTTVKERDLDNDLELCEDGSVISNSSRPIPKCLCRCVDCRCLFDPFSGLLLEMGNLARIEPRIPIIR